VAGPKTFETREHSLKIQKTYCRTKLRANFFGFRTVNMWNGLPDDATLKLNSFKEEFVRRVLGPGRPGADIYDLVFLCIDRRAIHHVLLTWPMY